MKTGRANNFIKLKREGKKVIVRPYQLSDYKAWVDAFTDRQVKPKNRWDIAGRDPKELTRSKFNQILKGQKSNREKDFFFDFGIFLRDGTLVGGVSLMDISRQVFQNAYLGYRVFNPFWGMGYGKEGVSLAVDIAFRDLNLHRLEAGIEPKNFRSISLAQSVGMKKEGLSKKRLFLDGKWLDMEIWALTCEARGIQWKPKKSKKIIRY